MKKVFLFLAIAIMAFVSCSKDNDNSSVEFNTSSVSLHAGEIYTLFESSSDVKINSENDFVASVSPRGVVTANHVGTTTISSGNSICDVTVKPRYNLYKEPYLTWDASISQVKAAQGTPYSESSTSLSYILSASPNIIAVYTFKSNKLTGVGIAMSTINALKLPDFLSERYKLINVDSSSSMIAIYVNANTLEKSTYGVGISIEGSTTMAVYAPTSQYTRASDFSFMFDDFKELTE